MNDTALVWDDTLEVLRRIRKLGNPGGEGSGEKLADLLRDGDGDGHKFSFRNALGVRGGAFGIVDPLRDRFVLLENSMDVDEQYEGMAIDIPYTPNGKASQGSLIDFIFSGLRRDQPLTETRDLSGRRSVSSPEFFRNLPPWDSGRSFQVLPHEEGLRTCEGYPFLHCTAGEVIYFVLTWRWLIRSAQATSLSQEPAHNERTRLAAHLPSVWSKAFWNTYYSEQDLIHASPEFNLISAIHRVENETQVGEERKAQGQNYRRDVLNTWTEFTESEAASERHFLSEWEDLGLSRSGRASNLLLALLRYMWHVAERQIPRAFLESELSIPPELHRYQELIEEAESQVCSGLKDKQPPSLGELCQGELDVAFQAIAYYSLIPSLVGKEPLTVNLLGTLHDCSRFPILPYYVQYKLERDKKPLEHLVMGVFVSDRFAQPVQRDITEFVSPANQPNVGNEVVDQRTLAACLLTIEPPWESTDTVALTTEPEHIPSVRFQLASDSASTNPRVRVNSEETQAWRTAYMVANQAAIARAELTAASKRQLYLLRSFFTDVAQPIVHACVIEGMIGKERQASGQVEMIGSFSHEVAKLGTGLLRDCIVQGDRLLDSGDAMVCETGRWLPPDYSISVSENLAERFRDWRVCPIPAVWEALNTQFLLWGASKNLMKNLGIATSDRTTLSDLAKGVWPRARQVGFLKLAFDTYGDELNTFEQLMGLEQHYLKLLRSDAELLTSEPEGSIYVSHATETAGHTSSLVRALGATFTNAIGHSDRSKPIRFECRPKQKGGSEGVTITIENEKQTGSNRDSSPIYDKKEKNPRRLGTFGVVHHAIESFIRGSVDIDGESPSHFVLRLWIPIAAMLPEGTQSPWLTRPGQK